MTKPKAQAKGGHARAKKLSPEERSAIAKKGASARWDVKDVLTASNSPAQHRNDAPGTLRDQIALAVLAGLYSNIADAQKFSGFVMGKEMLLPEAFTRIAYSQADEALRLRSL